MIINYIIDDKYIILTSMGLDLSELGVDVLVEIALISTSISPQ